MKKILSSIALLIGINTINAQVIPTPNPVDLNPESIQKTIDNPLTAAKSLIPELKNPFKFKLNVLGGLSLPFNPSTTGLEKFYQAKGFSEGLGLAMDKKWWGLNFSAAKMQLKIDEAMLTQWTQDKLSSVGSDIMMKLRPFTRMDFHFGPTANFNTKFVQAKVGVMPGLTFASQSALSVNEKTVSLNEKIKPAMSLKTIAAVTIPINNRLAFNLQAGFTGNVFSKKESTSALGEFEKEFKENSTFDNQVNISAGIAVLLNPCKSEQKKKTEGKDEFHLVYHKLTQDPGMAFYKVPSNFRFSFENSFTQTDYITFLVLDERGAPQSEVYKFGDKVQTVGDNRFLINLADLKMNPDKKYILRFNYLGNTLEAKIEFSADTQK